MTKELKPNKGEFRKTKMGQLLLRTKKFLRAGLPTNTSEAFTSKSKKGVKLFR